MNRRQVCACRLLLSLDANRGDREFARGARCLGARLASTLRRPSAAVAVELWQGPIISALRKYDCLATEGPAEKVPDRNGCDQDS